MDPILDSFQREIFARTGISVPAGQAIELSLGPASHINAPLTNLAVEYQNREMIADQVMPVVKVPKRSDKYFQLAPETMFSVAKTQLSGNEGMPGRVAYGLDAPGNYSVVDQGLMDFVSLDDQLNADTPLDPMVTSLEVVQGFLGLAREVRVAGKAFNSANYGSNHEALGAPDRWDNPASDPVAKILAKMQVPLVEPDTMVISRLGWNALRTHPKVIQYVIGRAATKNGTTPLIPDQEMIAAAFGLKQILVGNAIYNSAVEGQTFAVSRVWGKSCALIRVETQPNARRTQTFGYTFRFGQIEVRSIWSELPGRAGGTYLKVTHADDEKIVGGGYVGYLLETIIS